MLTRAQQRAYDFIRDYIQQYGHAPSVTEVAFGIGIKSKGVAHRYIQALADNGLLKIIPNRRRNIELCDNPDGKIPLVGKIAAGSPIEAVQHNEMLDLQAMFAGQKCYALKVQGDSMIEEGILDGDVVICEECKTAQDGEIVVALVDHQEATLKRFKHNRDGTITLLPANRKLKVLTYPEEQVQIQGRYLGLVRFRH